MCVKTENKYGFKVCYTTKTQKRKYKLACVTNSYGLAKLEKERQIKLRNKEDKLDWYILPIKTKKEYKALWKGCPF